MGAAMLVQTSIRGRLYLIGQFYLNCNDSTNKCKQQQLGLLRKSGRLHFITKKEDKHPRCIIHREKQLFADGLASACIPAVNCPAE